MKNIIGVRLIKSGKLYYFDAKNQNVNLSDRVIVETEHGQEIARVVKKLKENEIRSEKYSSIVRVATKEDIKKDQENDKKAKEALKFCKTEVNRLNLPMKLLTAEYTFDTSKLIIYFVAEERVDFRELVKCLASKYRARIELRQIGPRDEAKMYPALGMCGKETCCRQYLKDFDPITIKMAKEQGLQINMSKLSGVCGKLMCCLKYEEDTYKENLNKLPRVGDMVTIQGENDKGKVMSIDILDLKVKVKLCGEDDEAERYETYPVEMLKWNARKNIKYKQPLDEEKDINQED